jgi:hypothetical protein
MRTAYYEEFRIVNENLRTSKDFFALTLFPPPATSPLYLVPFSLDTTGRPRHNPAHRFCLPCDFFVPGLPGVFLRVVLAAKGSLDLSGASARCSHLNSLELCGH